MTYEELGDRVEAKWAGCKYDPSQFPRIAKEALDAVALPELERQRLLLSPVPAIPYRDNPLFQIEVRATSTSAEIRADARHGALRVAEGSGILTQYRFTPNQSAVGSGGAGTAPTVRYGALEQQGSSVVDANAEAIEVAPTAESVFPVTQPLTVVVITLKPVKPPKRERPWLYQRPGIALHTRRVLDDLAGTQTAQIDTITYARGFYIVIDALRRARWSKRTDLQFFLALLMTQQKRDFLLKLVQDWTRTDRRESLDIVAHWLETLIRRKVLAGIDPDPEPVPFAAFTESWSRMKDQVEAVTFLLRHVSVPPDEAPYARLPPPPV